MMQDGTINLEDYTKSDWTIMLNDRVITSFTTHEGNKLIIGRSPDADVVIDNTAISRHHSSLELRDGRHYLADLKSTNGTTVNGKKIASKVPITEKDVIFIGKFRLIQSTADEQHASSSYATAMDIDDEATVFVSSPRQQAASQSIQSAAPSANEVYRLTVIEGAAAPNTLSLDGKSSVKIGKDPACDMIIPGWLVSKTQCYVVSKKDKYYLVPQRSWANTKLNDVIIKEERLLRKGDIIQIKSVKIRFS
ncbi:MAG TPA: FHA domain-containing protein [Deltaproteobacteria bacterium]|nr:FHA domain-containing protein [Deltaproteobacteria bacterium]